MWFYVWGLALLVFGGAEFMRRLGPMDRGVPALQLLQLAANIGVVTCFIAGFFRFPWWVPFAAAIPAALVVQFVFGWLRVNSDWLRMFGGHFAIMAGLVLAPIGLVIGAH